jgi:CubicO group peptidase (beta-lactamase class C family)
MKKLIAASLFLTSFFSIVFVSAQTITLSSSPDKSVDQDRLGRIDTLVNDYINKGFVNGAVSLVIHNGRVVHYKGYGFSDVEAKKLMHQDDLFRIASQTKAVVSVGLMQLFEEGKFYLDEPVADFLPAFRSASVLDNFNAADTTYTTVPAKREITIRDLLTHTSGIDYPGIGSAKMKAIYAKAHIPAGLGNFDYDLKERIEVLARLPLVHQPGEKWTYGLSVDVLGCLVEVISGMNLEQYLTGHLFRPLGMKDTYFNVPATKAGRLVAVYTEDSLHHIVRWTKERTGIDPDFPLQSKHYFSGGAGLTCTAWDYAIFLQMMLNGGKYNGVHILSPRTVEMMTSDQLGFPYNGMDNFGLGFGIASQRSAARGVRNVGTFSWSGFLGTTYWVDPKAHLVGLFMTQQVPNSHPELERKVEQVIYQSFVN